MHGAHLFTSAAQTAGLGMMDRVFKADQKGGQDLSHGARIDPAEGMTTDVAEDRAVVHARAAADASEHVLKGRSKCR